MENAHATMVDNPYHYSFKLCANALSNQSNSVYSGYLNVTTKDEFHCDQCDRSFKNSYQLDAHIKEHVVCNTNGCTFTAHPKIISAHIRMQHHSGIFNKIKKLDNPEEVKKWLEERKRKYPTQSNIAKQIKLDTERKKRGELIEPNKERFNKNFSNRSGKRKRKPKNKKHPEESKPTTIEELISYEKKTKCNGALPEFTGTGTISEEVEEFEGSKKFYVSDEDETSINQNKSSEDKTPMNKSLALLMASYDSGDESEADLLPSATAVHTNAISNPLVISDDDEPPEEIKNTNSITDTSTTMVKRFPKHLNKGLKRPLRNAGNTASNIKKRKPTLLQKLLEKQIVHERNVILNCIHFIVCNDFLQKVADTVATQPPKSNIVSIFKTTIPHINAHKADRKRPNKKNFLLQGLLKEEIIKEQNIVLQCIRFITKNNFLQDIK